MPDKVFDAHAHLYRAEFWHEPPPHAAAGPPDVTLEVYRREMDWVLQGREVHALCFPYPFPTGSASRIGAANAWVAREIAQEPICRGQFLVRPADDAEWVRGEVNRLGLRGLKPFSFYADVPDAYQAEIPDYLPEPLMAVADQEGWSITLHLVRSRGIADASNQHWIRHYCETYSNTQLILDHAARGFNPYHVLEGLPALRGLGNLWIDTSSVTQAPAIEVALDVVGPRRLLYGSDFYVSHIRGTSYSIGDTFIWVDEATGIGKPEYAEARALPLVGIENLRAVKAAFWSAGLTDSQVEDYFWGNALRLVGIGPA
ncbi:MAG TPA: amidohydrolase family protein [Armatimonadota bacterium]|nr:amidohydrolase family protein [Armatimonadota bacterium]